MKRRQWLEWLDDAVNPIVVKEVRQAVHCRFLPTILLAFLGFQLATLSFYLMTKGASGIDLLEGASYGEEVFGVLISLLFFATGFCVPISAAVRMHAERSGQALALFFISTLPPRRVISGKLGSNLIVTLLLFSACMPYLSFTYFLRGIDLPTVFAALAVGFAASAAGILSAVFLASLQVSRFLKLLLALAGLGWLAILFSMSIGSAFALREQGVASLFSGSDQWGPMLVGLVICGALFSMLYVLAVALVTPVTANRALPVRRFIMMVWLVLTLGAVADCFIRGQQDLVVLWALSTYSGLAVAILAAIGARDQLNSRLTNEVPRSRLRRGLVFMLFSGSANGLTWAVVMIALTTAVHHLCNRRLGDDFNEVAGPLLGMCAFILAYALLAVLLQRRWLSRWIRRSQTWVLALTLITAFSLTPVMIGFLLSPTSMAGSASLGLWLVLNPFAVFSDTFDEFAIHVGIGWAVVMSFLARHWFMKQIRNFKPPVASDG